MAKRLVLTPEETYQVVHALACVLHDVVYRVGGEVLWDAIYSVGDILEHAEE